MNWLSFRPKRRTQRRVAPERLRKRQLTSTIRPRVEHAGEKIALLVLSGIGMALIITFPRFELGALTGYGVLIGLFVFLFARYTMVFSPKVVQSMPRGSAKADVPVGRSKQ